MATIVISANVTLDGVHEDPTGEEGLQGGGWFARVSEADRAAWAAAALAEVQAASALLLGRGAYAFFAARWPGRGGALADRMNAIPKYVVSSTPAAPEWAATTVVGRDEVAALKARLDGEIVVPGGIRLARALLAEGLADELRLTVFPHVLGGGERLFGAGGVEGLALRDARTLGDGLVHLTYRC